MPEDSYPTWLSIDERELWRTQGALVLGEASFSGAVSGFRKAGAHEFFF